MSATPDRPKQDKEAGLGRERLGGRFVTSYDPEMALKILERLAQGETLKQICAPGSGFCHPVTFKRWIVNHPELAKAYKAAKHVSAEALEEEALDLAREIRAKQRDGTQVRAYEVAIQQLRWSAERRDPEQFGNKAPISIKVPIQINTTMDLGGNTDAEIAGEGIYKLVGKQKGSVADALDAADDTKPLVKALPIKVNKHVKGDKPKT